MTTLAHKLFKVSTYEINDSIGDLYDIYILSRKESFRLKDLCNLIQSELDRIDECLSNNCYICDLSKLPEINNAYNSLLDVKDKPEFDVVYKRVLDFIVPIIGYLSGANTNNYKWDSTLSGWRY